jgi:hypothetical protein
MMKLKNAIISCLFFSVLFAANSAEAPVVAMGQVGCGNWIALRNTQKADLLEQWVLGFLDGLSMADKKPFWDSSDPTIQWKVVYSTLDGYCAANPMKTVLDGAQQLYRWRTSPPDVPN